MYPRKRYLCSLLRGESASASPSAPPPTHLLHAFSNKIFKIHIHESNVYSIIAIILNCCVTSSQIYIRTVYLISFQIFNCGSTEQNTWTFLGYVVYKTQLFPTYICNNKCYNAAIHIYFKYKMLPSDLTGTFNFGVQTFYSVFIYHQLFLLLYRLSTQILYLSEHLMMFLYIFLLKIWLIQTFTETLFHIKHFTL